MNCKACWENGAKSWWHPKQTRTNSHFLHTTSKPQITPDIWRFLWLFRAHWLKQSYQCTLTKLLFSWSITHSQVHSKLLQFLLQNASLALTKTTFVATSQSNYFQGLISISIDNFSAHLSSPEHPGCCGRRRWRRGGWRWHRRRNPRHWVETWGVGWPGRPPGVITNLFYYSSFFSLKKPASVPTRLFFNIGRRKN